VSDHPGHSSMERHADSDEQLANSLRAIADSVTAQADLGEVESGAARVRSRRRVAAGVAAAAIVAAAGGAGFGLGRAASVDPGNTAAMDAPPPGGAVPATTLAPPDPAPATTAPQSVIVPDGEATTTVVPSDEVPPPPDVPRSAFPGAPMEYEFVSERITDNGERIRMLRGPTYGLDNFPGGWSPAPFCWPNGEMRVTLDSPDLVDVTSLPYFTELFDRVAVQVGSVGTSDGRPTRLALIQTDTDATEATITWSDGLNGSAPVITGSAIVAVSDATDPELLWHLDYTVALSGPTGTTSMTKAQLEHYDDPVWRTACEEPPPPLPDAGEQPSDPDAGQLLADRFGELWSLDVPFAEKQENLLDDWTGVVAAAQGARTGPNADAVASATRTLDEYVFTSPTEAWLRYTIVTNVGTFGQRYATATLVDGAWQFPRAAVCQDFSLAGSSCQPAVEEIHPPAWYERARSRCNELGSGESVCDQP
jgi:hypothetical protein